MRRRTYLRTVGATAAAGLLAGCSSDGDDGGNGANGNGGSGTTVVVAPDGQFVFDPESITVSTGEAVTWTFESPGHNVECKPSASDYASLPDGAEPFASYEGDNRFGVNDAGTEYTQTFEVAGTYDYVCVPHAARGMRGTVVVEE